MSRDLYLNMLRYKRPAFSVMDRIFCEAYLQPLGCKPDSFGNYILTIGDNPTILWSSHTDTVHSTGGYQPIQYGEVDTVVTASSSDCLGADCTTGVYIMHQMILAKVPGLYIFHRAEEIGRQGSEWIAEHNPGLLKGIKYAIAFDRYGFNSIITHQLGSRCCSEAFSDSLAAALGGNGWESDEWGSYTDTASYTKLIPECTNLSVGYFDQHSRRERQHWDFLEWLTEKMCSFNTDRLVCERDPSVVEELDWFAKFSGPSYGALSDNFSRDSRAWEWDDEEERRTEFRTNKERQHEALITAILDHPDVVAEILKGYRYSAEEILAIAYGDTDLDEVEDGDDEGETE